MSKKTVLTGLRANNDLHIGHFFGALKSIVEMARNKSEDHYVNLFVPDLHSFTTPIDHSKFQEQIMHNIKLFVAAGLPLDKPDVHIYRQSYIPAHSELTWILDCFTGFGEMSRMTQFKEKSANLNTDRTSVGLFNYPVLMAADILLYNASYVPVGEDQTQHIEFTRDIAERLNTKFSKTVFTVPEPVKKQKEFFGGEQILKIKNLIDPLKKMSKSDESNKGIIFLTDKPTDAAEKILKASTDSLRSISHDTHNQPGISNLIEIYSLVNGHTVDDFVSSPWSKSKEYSAFKNVVAQSVSNFLIEFQSKFAVVDEDAILSKLKASEIQMNNVADETLFRVQKAVGLR